MRIIYISPLHGINPRLFPVLKKYLGEETYNPHEADMVFIELQSGTISYDQSILDIVIERKIKIIAIDNREWGSMNKETWKPVELPVSIYFIRNTIKEQLYPPYAYPFDWPYFVECYFPMTDKEELFSRPYDCCLISVESPARRKVVDAILKDGRLKLNYKFFDHTQRFSYQDWIAEHRKAKLYISCEGGGATNERPQQLFSVAAMLNVSSNYLPANEFTDGINCLEISENPTSEEIEKVVDILADKEWLWDIYGCGIQFTKENLSGEAVANYVLKIIQDESEKS